MDLNVLLFKYFSKYELMSAGLALWCVTKSPLSDIVMSDVAIMIYYSCDYEYIEVLLSHYLTNNAVETSPFWQLSVTESLCLSEHLVALCAASLCLAQSVTHSVLTS
jgi:hypothetical protein